MKKAASLAGGLLCTKSFLNGGARLPARCQGAALASRPTSSFAAKPCTWLGSNFPRFPCQTRQSERQGVRGRWFQLTQPTQLWQGL